MLTFFPTLSLFAQFFLQRDKYGGPQVPITWFSILTLQPPKTIMRPLHITDRRPHTHLCKFPSHLAISQRTARSSVSFLWSQETLIRFIP